MNTKISTKHVFPLFIALSSALSTTCGAQTIPLSQAVTFNNQTNVGPMTSGLTLQNIKVSGVALLNSSAIGNVVSVNSEGQAFNFNSANLLQKNEGIGNASIHINGNSEFGELTANATSAGNLQSVSLTAGANTMTTAHFAAQTNLGAQGASITWSVDPTGQAFLNSSALGNVQTLNIK